MNRIENDKISTLNAGQSHSGNGVQAQSNDGERLQVAVDRQKPRDDSYSLSPASKLLNQAVSASDGVRSAPETVEQAKTLVEKIKQQFTSNGSLAMNSYTTINSQELEGLLQSEPA